MLNIKPVYNMAILNNTVYERLRLRQIEQSRLARRANKIDILGKYFAQSDELLTQFDMIPEAEYRDTPMLLNRIGRIDLRAQNFDGEIYPSLVSGIYSMTINGASDMQAYTTAAGINFNVGQTFYDQTVARLELPYTKDVNKLISSGVYEARSYSEVGLNKGLSSGGQDRYNKMLENISKLPDKEQQKALLQSLANYINSAEPLGQGIIGTMKMLYGVEPTSSYSLSTKIWGVDKRDEVYKTVIDNTNKGLKKQEIITELDNYLKGTGQGGNYYKAERVIDTELQRAYTGAHRQAVRDYNSQGGGPKLFIKQQTSRAHPFPDICDSLAGVYDPAKRVPEIPRHPNCICLQSDIFVDDYKGTPKDTRTLSGIPLL